MKNMQSNKRKILIALNHPAHYYFFKYIIAGLKEKNHEVSIVIKEKDILEKLLISEKQEYVKLNEKKQRKKNAFSVISRGIIELVTQDVNLYQYLNKFKANILIGTDIAITHIGRLKGIPSIVFNEDDYEINKLFCKFSYPFANYIVAPEYTSVGNYNHKKIAYNGIQKMAYLNSRYFSPNTNILNELNIKKNEPFFIIRLVSLTAGHDIEGNHKGIDRKLLEKIISILKEQGRVFITSEDRLDEKLKKFQVKIPVNRMHDLMAFASLFIGDSQTMCAEAGILGTPFIRYNDFVGKIEYLIELEEEYELGWGVRTTEPEKIFTIIGQLFSIDNYKAKWISRRESLFADKIDLTAFTVWLVENYPESARIMKNDPDYQYRFQSTDSNPQITSTDYAD